METTSTHWTDDPDLVSEFALSRLGSAERIVLQKHLDGCEQCRNAVQLEREFAAGAKSAGRDLLRERLRERIKKEEPDWFQRYQIISLAAAVLVVLVGLGIFRLYVGSFEWPTKFSSSRYIVKRGLSDSLEEQNEKRELQNTEPGQVAGPRQDESDARTRENGSGFWLIGKVILISEGEGEAADKAQEEGGGETSKERSVSQDRIIAIQKDGIAQIVTLRQLPLASLPRFRFESDMPQAPHEVQTLVEKTPKGLNLTLYRDTLVRDAEFRKATIEPVTEDSLIVDLANERIAYHIPGGWSAQPSTNPTLERQ